ncbi:phosphomannomutase/phosphoglucomutase [candidate division KSB1 bacterium]|nr:MAG: phosphomannomutase/phosphoglucomutase [candidate division KSB1 bacterium]
MAVNPLIFREYDIRGLVETDLTTPDVREIGKGLGTFLKRQGAKRFTVGRDGRLSSERIANDLKEGLVSTGLEITDVGQCPTPVLYFSAPHLSMDGGVMITGSHNPPEFNGIKTALGKTAVYGQQIQEIRSLIERNDYEKASPLPVKSYAILDPYVEFLSKNLKFDRAVRVGMDSGNGVGGSVAPKIFRALGATVFDLYSEVDGRFPNHHPDPTVEKNLTALKKLVAEKNLEVGVGFDGDADRLGAIDQNGKVIWGDQLMTLFARDIVREHPGATVIADVKSSDHFFADVKKHGGNPIMWKTGHALIKNKLWTEKALLAGEMSGHFFFADRYFGFDDGIYAAGRLVEIVSRLGHTLSEELSDLPKAFNTPEIRVDCPDDVKFGLVDKVKAEFKKKGYETVDIDGVRVRFKDGWGLARASNTQPTLVLRFEANSPEGLSRIEDEFKDVLGNEGFTLKTAAGH